MDSQKLTGLAGERRRMAGLLKLLVHGLRGRLDEELRAQHVTSAQLNFLKQVRERPGGSSAQLARACHVTPQSAQAMLVRAVKHGWVVRGKDAENDRLVTVRLTAAGERLLGHAYDVLERLEGEIWDGVKMGELRAVNAVLAQGVERLGSAR